MESNHVFNFSLSYQMLVSRGSFDLSEETKPRWWLNSSHLTNCRGLGHSREIQAMTNNNQVTNGKNGFNKRSKSETGIMNLSLVCRKYSSYHFVIYLSV